MHDVCSKEDGPRVAFGVSDLSLNTHFQFSFLFFYFFLKSISDFVIIIKKMKIIEQKGFFIP